MMLHPNSQFLNLLETYQMEPSQSLDQGQLLQPMMPAPLLQPRPPQPPTLNTVQRYLAAFFPARKKDVQFVYHTPFSRWVQVQPVRKAIFSITPTNGVYKAIHSCGDEPSVTFLHRPFNLNRYRLGFKSHVTVLSSHVAFDEFLTTGWNTVLATRLGIDVDNAVCLQGYKGDPERRIGLVGQVSGKTFASLAKEISKEFRCEPEIFGHHEDGANEQDITTVAIMNAFHPDEVERVLEQAHQKGWLPNGAGDGSGVLYLTGQPRPPGLQRAMERGMKVVCVGHLQAEEWGIEYLAQKVRQEFPMLEVEEIYEPEEVVVKQPKAKQASAVERTLLLQ
ncbi:hypothetical protein M8818_005496 [Zalaria obscura]|uniref:Uncharacterized protein n=1 Tax=Zalaria obscura TaxID=2024903 RepID=A0ACC3S8R0_9PEZI